MDQSPEALQLSASRPGMEAKNLPPVVWPPRQECTSCSCLLGLCPLPSGTDHGKRPHWLGADSSPPSQAQGGSQQLERRGSLFHPLIQPLLFPSPCSQKSSRISSLGLDVNKDGLLQAASACNGAKIQGTACMAKPATCFT